MSDRWSSRRIVIAVSLLVVCLELLCSRVVSLHLGLCKFSRSGIEGAQRFTSELVVARGKICDTKGAGNVLALDLGVKDVRVNPDLIISSNLVVSTAVRLAPLLEMDVAEVMVRLDKPGRKDECLKTRVPEERARQIADLGLKGVFFRDGMVRHYPLNEQMCHAIGFSNHEGKGYGGVEQAMNGFLAGCPGLVESMVDGQRREVYVRRVQNIEPREGADVETTLDQHLQYMVEKVIERTMEQHRAKGVWAIVQRVQTGEILAMASRPSFNPNEFGKSTESQRLNRAIGLLYEPGSTMKIVAISAALNEGIVTPSTVIDCENGAWMHQGKILRDYHPYGELTVADVVKKSSNIGTAKLAVRLGDRKLHDYFKRFNIGGQLGFDLPGEESGILHRVSKWSAISSSRIGIGQGVAVTALQMLGAYCAIANNGMAMRPYVVRRVVSKDGVVLHERGSQELGRCVSRGTAETMKRLLAAVTEEGGTGRRAQVAGYTVAGKTGTAQKAVVGGYSQTDIVASFVGFLPVESPEIGIIVVVDEPQPVHVGGLVAAPAFAEIAAQAVRYLDIAPSVPSSVTVASYR